MVEVVVGGKSKQICCFFLLGDPAGSLLLPLFLPRGGGGEGCRAGVGEGGGAVGAGGGGAGGAVRGGGGGAGGAGGAVDHFLA